MSFMIILPLSTLYTNFMIDTCMLGMRRDDAVAKLGCTLVQKCILLQKEEKR